MTVGVIFYFYCFFSFTYMSHFVDIIHPDEQFFFSIRLTNLVVPSWLGTSTNLVLCYRYLYY
jgi:hypothetical protein